MQRNRLFATVIALIVVMAQPTASLGQEKSSQDNSADNPAQETYDGVPLCQNRRGVYPHPIYQPDPEYDDKARKKKIQGVVTLSAIVTTAGQTAGIKVVKTLTPGLDQQAIKAVSRWKFEPATQDGQPCPMRINIQVQFRLY